MTLYIIQHVATGWHLTQNYIHGASWWEPASPDFILTDDPPRLFKNARAAKAFIHSWARGRVTRQFHRSYDHFGNEDDDETLEIENVGRKPSDLRAIPVGIHWL